MARQLGALPTLAEEDSGSTPSTYMVAHSHPQPVPQWKERTSSGKLSSFLSVHKRKKEKM